MTDLKAIVEAMYNASAIGDFEKVESFLTDDFRVEESELLPFAGTYTGKQCLRELFPIVMETMGVVGMERGDMLVGKNSVANKVTLLLADDNLEPVEMMEVSLFKGDKVCEIRPYYFNPNQVIRACEAKSQATK